MPAPASSDLRQRVVEAYNDGEGSFRTIAEHFRVHFNSVARWVRSWRATGTVDPKPHRGGRSRKIPDEGRTVLRTLVEQQRDATLPELAARLQAQTGIVAAPPRVSEALTALKLPRKKSRRTRANSTGPTSHASAPSARSRRR